VTPHHSNAADDGDSHRTPGTDAVRHVNNAKRRRTATPAPRLNGGPLTAAKGTWEKLEIGAGSEAPAARWGAASCLLTEEGEVRPGRPSPADRRRPAGPRRDAPAGGAPPPPPATSPPPPATSPPPTPPPQGPRLFVVGGEGEGGYLSDTWVLDVERGSWERTLSVDNGGRAWHSLFVAGGTAGCPQLMSFGGERGPGGEGGPEAPSEVLNEMGAYDVECMLWYYPEIERAADFGAVPARAGHTTCVLRDGRVLVFGGVDGAGGFTNRTFVFSPSALRWESPSRHELRGAPPKPRAYHGAVQVGERLVVFGGAGKHTWSLKEVYTLDLGTWKWTEHTSSVQGDVPAPRFSHGAVALDGARVLVFGGWDPTTEPASHFADAAVLDVSTWTWSRVELGPGGPGAVAGHCMGRVAPRGGEPGVLVFGGRTPGGGYSADAYVLRVSPAAP